MDKPKIQRLLYQYLNDTINREDCIELLNFLKNTDHEDIDELIDVDSVDLNEGKKFIGTQSMDLFKRINSDPRFDRGANAKIIPLTSSPKFYQSKWIKLAAAAIVIITTSLLFFNQKRNIPATNAPQAIDNRAAVII